MTENEAREPSAGPASCGEQGGEFGSASSGACHDPEASDEGDAHDHSHDHGASSPPRVGPVGTVYVCPMHPEVEETGPAACPLCGMALEPLMPAADEGENPELVDFRRRLWIGAALTLPVFALAMGGMVPGALSALPSGASGWIQLALSTPVVLWCGLPFFQRGWSSLRTRNYNMFTLIALGVGAAYGFSVFALLIPDVFPASLRTAGGGIEVYFESAAVIICLVLLGQVLELRARGQAGAAIRSLLDLAPEMAIRVERDGSDTTVPVEEVRVGDRLRVVPGERVPVDGVVIGGESAVDESMVTGEPIPRSKSPGDRLFGSTLNGAGSLVMAAERVGADTLLARIVAQVSEAQRSRAPIQRVADAVAGWFVPVVAIAALLAFVVWAVVGPEPRLGYAIVAAVSVLIIACPCALGLATPMSIMVAAGRGAAHGILFRDAEALERLRDIDMLLVDKTGTLTEGIPRLAVVEPCTASGLASGFQIDEDELLRLAASLERGSEHPLASAIVTSALERGLALEEPERFVSVTGRGIEGRVGGHELVLGSARLLAERGIDDQALEAVEARANALRAEGQTVMLAAIDGEPAGLFGVADPIKATTAAATDALQRAGIQVAMLTGDDLVTARSVASRLGISDVTANVLPEEKLAVVERLQREGHVVAMAGDGINDAPALARADVGIAMGTGSDVAIESAGVTLVEGDLQGLVRARRLSQATMTNIRQNLFFAFGYNALGVPIAAGVLFPFIGLLLSPMVAAAAMSLSSVSVIANALRLRSLKLD